jgi:hypothetical protein
VSFLASLTADAREELSDLVREVVREELRTQERNDARREWLSTTDVSALISTSENAVRCRLRRGWLGGDVARDGKRLLVRRSAVLDWLDRRAEQ